MSLQSDYDVKMARENLKDRLGTIQPIQLAIA